MSSGRDISEKGTEEKVKSERELEKERKKAEKDAKFKAKMAAQAKLSGGKAVREGGEKEKRKNKADEEQLGEYIEEIKKGEKKILKPMDDSPFTKAYVPKVVESAWNDWWDKKGFFKPEYNVEHRGELAMEKGSFTIPMPPPNVTGKLHCGHALATALQDILIRWHRMQGYQTLYLPGCDHAGISTQSVVENMLWRRQKKTRHDLGRPKFLETVMEWKNDHHDWIVSVLKRMGGSFDWTREAFTMDENLSAAVTETFVRLHEKGLIYRSNRLVNWCTQLNTALSNLEVDNKEIPGRTLLDVPGYDRKVEFGVLTSFKYPINGKEGEFIVVATTRPETMLGDTAIAVHPNDSRYKGLVDTGAMAKHPFLDRLLPIIADDYVDPGFGTGAVKITPAHDPNDFAIGKRHNLGFINILTDDGHLNHNAGPFKGQKRFDARYSVIDRLNELGLFVKQEDNAMKVPLCSKSKDVIEPLQKPQWWMKIKELSEPAIQVVKDGKIKIRPETSERVYYHWMENINDWCLSRQLWWGHQIPAYFVKIEGKHDDSSDNDSSNNELWVTGRTLEEATEKAKIKFKGKNFTLVQDEDVLDTWFSSGLWPFSTLGWPKETNDLKELFPTSVLETGWDILPFWVARMIMLSLKLTGKIPFKEVYCHSLIRDSEGRKMSKSLGNVVDPIDIMTGIGLQQLKDKLLMGNLDPKELKTAERYQNTAFPQGIPECGADALRMALCGYTTGGGDISFDVSVIHGYRKFCNKIYQATKVQKTGKETLPERWILHKLAKASKDMSEHLASRDFSLATQVGYKYFLNNLCDVFIENSKAILDDSSAEHKEGTKQTLYTALEGGLLLLHPFMPFLTEELFQRLPRRQGDKTPSITVADFPDFDILQVFYDLGAEKEYELLVDISKGLRSLTAEYGIKRSAQTFIHPLDDATHKILQTSTSRLSILSLGGKNIGSLTILAPADPAPTDSAVYIIGTSATVYLNVEGQIDIDKEITKAKARRNKANETIRKQLKIMDPSWEAKASELVKDAELEKLRAAELESGNFEKTIAQFEKMKMT
ncbi:valyl-tRNA synthetase [Aaosphaeria arxii CBS 175.79]|uniref:Valine--tRNA ligase, mitochondrial n=1 Tax=Aaosphaeria arxii CBS 175.79 TaxID=1450172 RepID=A0A6A5X6X8_9PLEO|nr:valyl-tRNA synthetase [Aaosphaeria arxii CBS 175.79]KAF2008698.1 valyl-tRNA synthetase [Aaosphaeria arxii CBS 175.79]